MEPENTSKPLTDLQKNLIGVAALGVILLFVYSPALVVFTIIFFIGFWIIVKQLGLKFLFSLLAIATLLLVLTQSFIALITMICTACFVYLFLLDDSQPSSTAAPPPPPPSQPPTTPTERLRALEDAYQQKLLTEAEYLTKRQQIIDQF